MQLRFELALALGAALALSVSACGSDDDDNGEGSGGTGGGTAGTGGAGDTIKLGATFVDYLDKSPVEGLEVCTLIPEGRDPGCAETIATGQIVAEGFPTNSEVLFNLSKDGYATILIPGVTGEQDDTGSTLFPFQTSTLEMLLSTASLTLESGKGMISFLADKSKPGATTDQPDGQDGVGVTISPAGGTLAYLDGVTLDTSATETFAAGLGMYVNLDPGEYDLTFTHADHTCTPRLGWNTDQPNVSTVPVQADKVTYVFHQCGD